MSAVIWSDIANRTAVSMLTSWRFHGKTGESLWKLLSSCSETADSFKQSYQKMTGKKLTEATTNINGKVTHQLGSINYGDGMFNKYQDLVSQLNNSKFIGYRIGGEVLMEHRVVYLYDQATKIWVPVQAWQGVITLADWLKVIKQSNLFNKFLALNKSKQISPITHPQSYWSQTWSLYMQEFKSTQLLLPAYQQLKNKKMEQLTVALNLLKKENGEKKKWITYAVCDRSNPK